MVGFHSREINITFCRRFAQWQHVLQKKMFKKKSKLMKKRQPELPATPLRQKLFVSKASRQGAFTRYYDLWLSHGKRDSYRYLVIQYNFPIYIEAEIDIMELLFLSYENMYDANMYQDPLTPTNLPSS